MTDADTAISTEARRAFEALLMVADRPVDPQLLARLLECKTFKDASIELERIAQEAGRSFPRTAGLEERFVGLLPDVLEGGTPIGLREAYARATAPRPVGCVRQPCPRPSPSQPS